MIKSISFQNFRGFKHLDLQDLTQITLLSGKNNAGKSTVLEGLFLLADHYDPMCFSKICNFRNLPVIPDFDILWKPLFHKLNADEPIQISARLEQDTVLTYYREDSYSPLPQDLKGMMPDSVNRFITSAQNGYTLGFHFTQEEISYSETGHFVAAPDGIALNMNTNLPNNQQAAMPLMLMINSQIATLPPVELFGKLELDGRKSEILQLLNKMDQALSDITAIVRQHGR